MRNTIAASEYELSRTELNQSAFTVISFLKKMQHWSACWRFASVFSTYIDGAAQQRASLQGFADDPGQISGGAAELVHLGHTACEVLKAFRGASSRKRLIGAIQPGYTWNKHFSLTSVYRMLFMTSC